VLESFNSVAKPVQKVLNWVTPWVNRILGASSSSDSLSGFMAMGPAVKEAMAGIRPLMEMFGTVWNFMKEPMAKFLPKLNATVSMVDRMYTLGKDIFLKWWNIDTWLEREAVKRLTLNTAGKDNATLAPWGSLPYCSEGLCIRQETRSSPTYTTWLFFLRYLQFYDLSSPPILGGDGNAWEASAWSADPDKKHGRLLPAPRPPDLQARGAVGGRRDATPGHVRRHRHHGRHGPVRVRVGRHEEPGRDPGLPQVRL